MAVQLTRRRFTVDEYYQMAEAGILNEDDRVELIDGEIVEMPPIGPGHSGSVDKIYRTLFRAYDDIAQIRSQNPIRLDQYNEPQPDFSLLKHRADSYRSAHPGPDDVLLVIEVADTSLRTDRDIKLRLYARFGIQETWLVDLQHNLVVVAREPTAEGYRLITTARRGDRLAPVAFPDRALAVDDILP
jgi:Uma2 family endonuclease